MYKWGYMMIPIGVYVPRHCSGMGQETGTAVLIIFPNHNEIRIPYPSTILASRTDHSITVVVIAPLMKEIQFTKERKTDYCQNSFLKRLFIFTFVIANFDHFPIEKLILRFASLALPVH